MRISSLEISIFKLTDTMGNLGGLDKISGHHVPGTSASDLQDFSGLKIGLFVLKWTS